MHETIIPRHVKTYKDGFTYVISLAGVKTKGGHYSSHIQAAYEAELATWYFRKKYGIKWHTVRARIPEETLQGYADECGFKLTVEEVFQRLPRDLRELLNLEGNHIAAKFAELETPTCREVLIRDGRRERQQFKLDRIAAQKAASIEKAAAWRQAQIEVAKAWLDAKIELEGLRKEKLTITP